MAEQFHITEVADFTEADIKAMSAAYESAMAGGKLTRVDESDGTYSLLDSDGNWVGCGVSAPRGCLHEWQHAQNWCVTYCAKCGDCRGSQASFEGFKKHYSFKANQRGIYLRLTGPLPEDNSNLSNLRQQGDQNGTT